MCGIHTLAQWKDCPALVVPGKPVCKNRAHHCHPDISMIYNYICHIGDKCGKGQRHFVVTLGKLYVASTRKYPEPRLPVILKFKWQGS